jgi:aldehyde:ferredoxin oxidoreductase
MSKKDSKLPPGYMGHILRVDLSSETIKIESLNPRMARLFFGGRGFGIAFLCQHFLALQEAGKYKNAFLECDPLSADNVIVISTSPTTGTRMPTSGRIHMNYKSPLTGAYGSTNGGGRWSVDFKKNGYDGMIITGKAVKPLYLVVSPEGVAFSDAGPIAHLDAVDTRNFLKEKLSQRAQVLTIGNAGKNCVRFAAVMSDTGKALGRGGGGAVWGSKNLFAIAVLSDPSVKIDVAHPESFDMKKEGSAMYHVKMKMDMGKFTKKEDMFGILASMGSLGILGMVNNYNQLIHNNMQDTQHIPEQVNRINGEALRYHYQNARPGEKKIKVKKSACFNCPIVCKRETTLFDENENIIEQGEGPEFESTTLLGADLSIYDLPIITQANYLANRYGLDTISLGATIAAFFELYEFVKQKKDSLSEDEKRFLKDIRDFIQSYGEPGFGKSGLLIPIIHSIGQSRGIGKHLSQGSFRFCRRYGHAEFSMSVKGLELPAYDPRTSFSQALCYEMNNRGGGHLQGGYTAPHAYCAGYAEWPANRIEGTPLISKNATLKNTTLDIIGVCVYGSFSLGLDEYASLINGVTGENHNSETLRELARRTITLERTFNILCGLSDKDDWLPDRFYSQTLVTRDGPVICDREGFGKMHMEYYRSVGWDDHGRPTGETLETLELLDWVPAGFEKG